MNDSTVMTPAETALSLLFRKLHPHLEDAAHALARGATHRELERLHGWRRTVILGLTADARQEQINEGQAAGMTVCSSPSDWRRSITACVGTCSGKSRVTWSSAWRRSGGIWGR